MAHKVSPRNRAMSYSGRGRLGVPWRHAGHAPAERSHVALIGEVLGQNPSDFFQDFFAVHIHDCLTCKSGPRGVHPYLLDRASELFPEMIDIDLAIQLDGLTVGVGPIVQDRQQLKLSAQQDGEGGFVINAIQQPAKFCVTDNQPANF